MGRNIDRAWLNCRRNFYSFVFAFHVCQYVFIAGVMTYGAFYLKDLGEQNVPDAFHLMLSLMVICGCFSSFVFGRLVDLTGSVKEITVGTQVVIIATTILYVFGPEPVAVGLAYGLFGLSDGMAVVLRSELCRCYDTSVITTIQLVVRFGSVVGTALGCLLAVAGVFAKVEVGTWHVSGANFGIVIAGAEFLVLLIASFFAVTNLSREYNFKAKHVEKEYEALLDTDTASSGLLEHETLLGEERFFARPKAVPRTLHFGSLRLELALLLRCVPTFKVLVLSFLHGCVSMSFERFLPLIGNEILTWQKLPLILAYLCSCIPPLFAIILYWLKGQTLDDYTLLFGGYWFIIACGLVAGVLGIFVDQTMYPLVIFTFILPAHKLSWAFQDAVTCALMSKLVPSRSQCVSEASRYFTTSCGMCIGAFLTAVGYHNLIIYCGLMLLICIFSFVLLWSEREVYRNPKLLWIVNAEELEFSTMNT